MTKRKRRRQEESGHHFSLDFNQDGDDRVMAKTFVSTIAFVLLLCGCSLDCQTGMASYYSDKLQGRKTASGEPYEKNAMTAAHKKIKLGTRVRVTNLDNGRSVIVRINDRGPFVKGRIIDLSRLAASKLGFIERGVARVKIEEIE